MQAIRCHRFSGLDEDGKPVPTPDPLRDVLSLDELPAPECGEGDVLVSAHYVGVQYPDALQAQGLYQVRPPLPYVPGMDLTGTVLEVGEGVEHLQVGDRVIAQMGIGAMAEVVNCDARAVWKAPDNVPLSHCANVGRNFFAAYHSLKVIGELGPGDLVLIDGASGGVGMAGIQLAKAMGAQVIAGVSVPEKQEYPAAAGADRVLCYGRDRESHRAFKKDVKEAARELGHPDGVDLVLDMVQGDLFEGALVSSVRPLDCSGGIHGRTEANPTRDAAHQASGRHRQPVGPVGQLQSGPTPGERRRDPRLHGVGRRGAARRSRIPAGPIRRSVRALREQRGARQYGGGHEGRGGLAKEDEA